MQKPEDRGSRTLRGLHPDLVPLMSTVPDYRPGDVHAARALMAEAMGGSGARPSEILNVERGDARIEVRIHRPGESRSEAALFFVHGGGFFMGSAALYDGVCSELASATGCTVLAVDYRLAPEHPFPTGLDDCESAWLRVVEEADRLGIDRTRIGLYGESAGAALAIGLAHRLKRTSAVAPALLVVQEPVIDDRLDLESSRAFTQTPIWNRALAEWSWRIYLGDRRTAASDEYAPSRLADLSGLPPTFISTRDLDPLRDEGLGFARRLIDDGVAVDIRHYAGTVHGTLGFTGARIRERVLRDAAEYVVDNLVAPQHDRH